MFGINFEKQALKILTAKMKEGGFNSVFFFENPQSETGFTFEFYSPEDNIKIIKGQDIDFMKDKVKELSEKVKALEIENSDLKNRLNNAQ